jgi:hypothetical protein
MNDLQEKLLFNDLLYAIDEYSGIAHTSQAKFIRCVRIPTGLEK